ncbi:CRISPR-associated protein Cas5 [bacterium]|nr:CRISPR-associated protein Cas5 [bacterium]
MLGAKVELTLPYFACFRHPKSTSLVLTHPIPPFTTIIGMLGNAKGIYLTEYPQFAEEAEKLLLMNIRPLELDKCQRELAKLLKLKKEERRAGRITSFPSSPMYRYFLVRPSYMLYIASEKEDFLRDLLSSLRNPFRPLYLGQSDDMVIVDVVWEGEVKKGEGREVWGLIFGIYEGCEYIAYPLTYVEKEKPPIFSLPQRFPFTLNFPLELYFFNNEGVPLYNRVAIQSR